MDSINSTKKLSTCFYVDLIKCHHNSGKFSGDNSEVFWNTSSILQNQFQDVDIYESIDLK